MPICLVIAHPSPSSLSFQIYHELAEVLESEGHKVFRQDLYGDSFNPVMPLDELKRRMSLDPLVTRYSRELTECESLVVIHPDWWAGPPAILKGWVDRLFAREQPMMKSGIFRKMIKNFSHSFLI